MWKNSLKNKIKRKKIKIKKKDLMSLKISLIILQKENAQKII